MDAVTTSRRDTLFLRGLRFWLPTIGGDGGDGDGGVSGGVITAAAPGIGIGADASSDVAVIGLALAGDFLIATLWYFFLSGDRPFFRLLVCFRSKYSSKSYGRNAWIF